MLPYTRVGMLHESLGARIIPGTGDRATEVVLDGSRSAARYAAARANAGTRYDALAKETFFVLDEALEAPWVLRGQMVLYWLGFAGLSLRIDAAVVETLQDEQQRALAIYPRWRQLDDGSWSQHPGTIRPDLIQKADATLRALGWRKFPSDADSTRWNSLFEFGWKDVCAASTKKSTLLATSMGLSKSRLSVALSEVYKVHDNLPRTIVSALKRHLLPWHTDELPFLEPLIARYGQNYYGLWAEKKDKPDWTTPYLLVSLERITFMTDEEFVALKKYAANSVVILDEAYTIAGQSRRAARALELEPKHVISLSGTPFKGMADSAFQLLNFTFGSGTVEFPDYPIKKAGSGKKFDSDFITIARSEDGQSSKRVPILKNPEKFYAMLQHLVVRRTRTEPEVVAVLGNAVVEVETVEIALEGAHLEYYEGILEQFREWYRRKLIERGEPEKFLQNELLVKLGYLIRAMSQPWAMEDPEKISEDDDWNFPAFPRGPTAIHKWALEKVIDEVAAGKQVLVSGRHTHQLDLFVELLKDHGIEAGLSHGGISEKDRAEVYAAFKRGDIPVIVGSLGTIAEAQNFGGATVAISLEPDWSAGIVLQFEGRTLRGMSEVSPQAYRMTAPGSIFEYVWQWSGMKQRAISAGLDGRINLQARKEDVLDVQSYCFSLALETNPKFIEPRKFFLETA